MIEESPDGLSVHEMGDRRFRVDWSWEGQRQRPRYVDFGSKALRLARGLAVLSLPDHLARHGLRFGVTEVRILDRQTEKWWTVAPSGTAAEVLPLVPLPQPPRGRSASMPSGRR